MGRYEWRVARIGFLVFCLSAFLGASPADSAMVELKIEYDLRATMDWNPWGVGPTCPEPCADKATLVIRFDDSLAPSEFEDTGVTQKSIYIITDPADGYLGIHWGDTVIETDLSNTNLSITVGENQDTGRAYLLFKGQSGVINRSDYHIDDFFGGSISGSALLGDTSLPSSAVELAGILPDSGGLEALGCPLSEYDTYNPGYCDHHNAAAFSFELHGDSPSVKMVPEPSALLLSYTAFLSLAMIGATRRANRMDVNAKG